LRAAVRALLILSPLFLIGFVLYTGAPTVLSQLGTVLIENDDGPGLNGDAILVLAGDPKGERIMKACELASAGVAPVVLVSGPYEIYGQSEADLAIAYAVSHGCPSNLFQACKLTAHSTKEEAQAFLPELRRRKIHKLILVTSNYHTARAGRIFRSVMKNNPDIRVISANDSMFDAQHWWEDRESRKTWLLEMTKTVTSLAGI
jgi:uncharacterized SAM-binding protein YcdF (DUF218 family)